MTTDTAMLKKTEENPVSSTFPLLNQRSAEAVLNQYIGNGDKYKL